MQNFSFPDQVSHGRCDLLYRSFRIDTVLVEDAQRIDAETPQRFFTDFADVRRGTVLLRHHPFAVHIFVPEFRGYKHTVFVSLQSFAHQNLIFVRTIRLRRIEKSDSAFNRFMHKTDFHFFIRMPAAVVAEPHTAESKR